MQMRKDKRTEKLWVANCLLEFWIWVLVSCYSVLLIITFYYLPSYICFVVVVFCFVLFVVFCFLFVCCCCCCFFCFLISPLPPPSLPPSVHLYPCSASPSLSPPLLPHTPLPVRLHYLFIFLTFTLCSSMTQVLLYLCPFFV